MKYIAWRFFNDRRPAYVAEINTSGKGDRYGYVSREEQAIPISEAEWKRFSRYMYDVGSVGFCSPFPDRKPNPAKKKPVARAGVPKSKYVKRPSQATGAAPSKRLKARRAANVVGSGRFPNPAPKKDAQPYKVQILSTASKTQSWKTVARFAGVTEAKDYANAYPRAYKVAAVRVYVD
jgi:hypothetical protein